MKPDETKPDLARTLYDEALAPVLAFVAIRGNKTALVRAVQEQRPTLSRNTIESWIASNFESRAMPLFDNALLLIECGRRLGASKKTRKSPNPKTTT